jgi:CrcB protein
MGQGDLRGRRRGPVLGGASAALGERWDLLLVIAAGGALGSAARYGVAEALPHEPVQLPWSTALVNAVGGFLLGALMVFVLDVWAPRRYVRPFIGVGVLGGFTTFSTYMVDTVLLVDRGHPATALLYLLGSLLAGLAAVWAGLVAARAAVAARRRVRRSSESAPSQPVPRRTP